MNNRVIAAIEAIRAIDEAYWEGTLTQRLPNGAGSIVSGDFSTTAELERALLGANWEEYSHEAIMEGTVGFITHDLGGRVGVIDLDKLPAERLLTLDDRKNTGKVSATVQGVLGDEVGYIVLIIGTEDGVEVCFTFHPGSPVVPSNVQVQPGFHGKAISVAEAIGMGLTTAKIVA